MLSDEATRVVNQYADMVHRLALARTGNHFQAEEVFQDVFLKYMRYRDRLACEEHLKAWLIRTTITSSKDQFRTIWLNRNVPHVETFSFSTEERSDTFLAVMSLPKKYRTVIHLFYYEDLSIETISSYLGIRQGTIKSQLSRGREMLRSILKEDTNVQEELSGSRQ